MPDQPVKHGHQHGPQGPDPVPFPAGANLPRARVWPTYAVAPYTVTSGAGHLFVCNHGYSTDPAVIAIQDWGGGTVRPQLLVGGIYAVTYRLVADAHGSGAWADTKVRAQLSDIDPDYAANPRAELWPGDAAFGSFVTTINDHEDWVPTGVSINLSIPAGLSSLTYGDAGLQSSWPIGNTKSYLEVVRLGAAEDTQDWLDWWYETPADMALPTV